MSFYNRKNYRIIRAIATVSGANLNGYQFFSVLNNIRQWLNHFYIA